MNGNPFFPSFCVFFLFEVWIELTCHSVGRVCKGETGERQSHMCSHHYSAGEKLSLSLSLSLSFITRAMAGAQMLSMWPSVVMSYLENIFLILDMVHLL